MTMSKASSAAALLDWYRAMGVDEAIGNEGIDRFAAVEASKRQAQSSHPPRESKTPPPPAAPRREFASLAPDEAVMDARARAGNAKSLKELETALADFEGCPLKATAKNTCFRRGSDDARVMFIGEGPGRDEDLQGIPFVGRAGQLLDKMLAAISLTEDDVYITNIVYWRPPGNRTPTLQEVQACMPFIERQVELLDPDYLVLIGGPASQNLLGTKQGIMRLRGKWQDCEIGGKTRRALPILHPAYLLRTPAAKRQAWRDLLTLKTALEKAD
ncbi:MAG: uracil-DNA glycosylase [Hyphomicrobiaceae bacterium]|nr:uracil-DNA glycosylase [Hyphomicrobiaceae bacterium]